MAASWLVGVTAMSIAIFVYYMAMPYLPNALEYPVGFAIPLLGALAGAMVTPHNKFKRGFSTIIPGIVLMGAFSYVAGMLGVGDNVGLEGTIIGTTISLPFIIGAVAIGALLGEWVSRRRADA